MIANRRAQPSVSELNQEFATLSYRERLGRLYHYFSPEEVLLTSSFGTQSVFLLHLMQQIQPSQRVYFLNTNYHFPETLAYKNALAKRFSLEIVEVYPEAGKHGMTQAGRMWESNPDRCCHYNKVLPLRQLKQQHRVWISGVMAFQTQNRQELSIFEPKDEILKFHPLLDMDEGHFLYEMGKHRLPAHPLAAQGYGSVGCTHCTSPGAGRTGRWKNSGKTECGLHQEKPQN